MVKENLINFESEIADLFNNKKIKSPIHLYYGNEDFMIEIFKKIDIENDWVCCTWRNHYQALLKGVPSELLRDKIISGKSMVMNLPEYKFICSSIVGGIPSIATQAALCGCLSIVIPDENYPKEKWIEDHPFIKYGVAYGFEDIEHALNTKHLLKPYLREIEKNALQSVKDFVNFWKKKVEK